MLAEAFREKQEQLHFGVCDERIERNMERLTRSRKGGDPASLSAASDSIMDDAAHAIVATDRSGKIRQWSAGAQRLFGWAEREALGQSLDLIVPPEFREAHWKGFHAAMDSGKSQLDRQATQMPVLCKDGQVRPFPARITVLCDADGRAAGNVLVYTDPKG